MIDKIAEHKDVNYIYELKHPLYAWDKLSEEIVAQVSDFMKNPKEYVWPDNFESNLRIILYEISKTQRVEPSDVFKKMHKYCCDSLDVVYDAVKLIGQTVSEYRKDPEHYNVKEIQIALLRYEIDIEKYNDIVVEADQLIANHYKDY